MRRIDLHKEFAKADSFFLCRFRLVTDPVNQGAPMKLEAFFKRSTV